MKRKVGFTLIELLVIIAIVGILGALLWSPIHKVVKERREKKDALVQVAMICSDSDVVARVEASWKQYSFDAVSPAGQASAEVELKKINAYIGWLKNKGVPSAKEAKVLIDQLLRSNDPGEKAFLRLKLEPIIASVKNRIVPDEMVLEKEEIYPTSSAWIFLTFFIFANLLAVLFMGSALYWWRKSLKDSIGRYSLTAGVFLGLGVVSMLSAVIIMVQKVVTCDIVPTIYKLVD